MNGLPLSQFTAVPLSSYTSLDTLQRGFTKTGYQGQQYGNAFDAVADYHNLRAAGIAALFAMPLLGISVAIHEGYYAVNVSRKEQDLAAIFEAFLFPADGVEPEIISRGEFDIEEMRGEVKVSSRITGKSFTIKGTFSSLREEWKKDIQTAANSSGKKPSSKIMHLQNNIMCEQAVAQAMALYKALPGRNGDWSALSEGVVELTEATQAQINEGRGHEEMIAYAVEKLGLLCPGLLQEPEQSNVFALDLIKLASFPLTGKLVGRNLLADSRGNPATELFERAVKSHTRSTLPLFASLRKIDSHIVSYLDNPSLRAMRMVSVAARDQAEKKLIPQCLNFNQLEKESGPRGCTYFEHVNIARVRLKLVAITGNVALFAQFVTSLAKNNHIQTIHLDLSWNGLGKDIPMLSAVVQALSLLPNLKSLNIKRNHIGNAGAELISRLATLTSLDISSNQLGHAGAESIAKLTALTELDIGSNYVRDGGAACISKLLNLTSLDIRGNQIGEAGAECISRLPNLTSLNIRGNELRDAGAAFISTLSTLTSLDIYWNNIGKTGAELISRLPDLTNLDISDNELGDAGAQFISRLPKLKSLNISNNELGGTGKELISRLQKLNRLDM
ncbi:MAG: hypothetical protein K0R08_1115 [Solimicrobium sp.]|jgi:Leucine-rich repeat (LRR) protein|nr:hypothetical protein [Solimicrobium sp.]